MPRKLRQALCTKVGIMTKKRNLARAELRKAADILIKEMNLGKWDHVINLRIRSVEELSELIDELESRCPGHTRDEYVETFLRSNWENR